MFPLCVQTSYQEYFDAVPLQITFDAPKISLFERMDLCTPHVGIVAHDTHVARTHRYPCAILIAKPAHDLAYSSNMIKLDPLPTCTYAQVATAVAGILKDSGYFHVEDTTEPSVKMFELIELSDDRTVVSGVFLHACMHTYIHANIHAYTHLSIHPYICIYIISSPT
jgi:hypothetical protein